MPLGIASVDMKLKVQILQRTYLINQARVLTISMDKEISDLKINHSLSFWHWSREIQVPLVLQVLTALVSFP